MTAPLAITYIGWIDEHNDCRVVRRTGRLGARNLNPRFDLRNHSPTGFAWGYGGSGPAQLALALVADVYGDVVAQKFYQEFKRTVIAALPKSERWEMTREEVITHVAKIIKAERDEKPRV